MKTKTIKPKYNSESQRIRLEWQLIEDQVKNLDKQRFITGPLTTEEVIFREKGKGKR